MCTQSECQHDWDVTHSYVKGEYRIRRLKCTVCELVRKQVIPLEHAPRRKFSAPGRKAVELAGEQTAQTRLPSVHAQKI